MKHIISISLIIVSLMICTTSWAELVTTRDQVKRSQINSTIQPTTKTTTANSPDPNVQGNGNDGAVPEPTKAEELQKAEEVYQQKIDDLKVMTDDIEKRLTDLRRQTVRPMQEDLDRLENDLSLTEKELGSIDLSQMSSLTNLQYTQLQDRVFQCRVSMEILNKRWSGDWDVFGLSFFKNAPPVTTPDNKAVPADYKIRKGDTLLIVVHSNLGAQDEYTRQVDSGGNILFPGAGRVDAAGRTASQLQKVLTGRIVSRFKQLSIDVTVQSLSPIQVQVNGEAERPGTYVLNGIATVLNALYQAGGPKKTGSLRHISLVRSGCPIKNIDLYDFLLKGSKEKDALLEDGDSIFIYPVGHTIVVGGEVVRPGRYEPDFPITLGQAIKLGGGTKASGYLKNVQVERVENGEYKVLLSEKLDDGSGKSSFALKPGDQIIVTTIKQDPTNQVEINGLVGVPGMYGFSEGMLVSDLVKMAQGLAKNQEIYGGRADILRIEPLMGTEIISFNLDKALNGDPKNNIKLHKLDRVFIYSPDQVVFQPRLVTLEGCVARPGTYKRTGGMRVSDIVAAAGGVLPQAYLKRVDLVRTKQDETTKLIRVDLQAALDGIPEANIELQDRDKLTVFTHNEVQWQNRTVRIEGAVQRPGVYTRSEGMRVTDLIFTAGGLLPEAAKAAEVAQCTAPNCSAVVKINLEWLVPQSECDLILHDSDVVTIPSVNPYLREPEIVFVSGEVVNPGPYVIRPNEKLSDIIYRAGGLTASADMNGVLFLRDKATFEKDHQDKDSDVILEKSKLFADKQFLTQLAKMGVKLPEDFMLSGNKNSDDLTKPVEINGELASGQAKDGFGGEKAEDILRAAVKGKDANNLSAMGAPITQEGISSSLDTSAEEPLIPAAGSARISINFNNALKDYTSPDNMLLRDGDRIMIPRVTNIVTVKGAVLHPNSFSAGPGKSVDFYVKISGGYAQDAAVANVIVVRSNGDALPKNEVKSVMPGDTIVVPNTGLIDITKKWEKAGTITKVLSDVLSAAYILTKL